MAAVVELSPWVDIMCERFHHGRYPEVYSTASAIFIVVCGAHMLLYWRTEIQMMSVVGSCFVVNGWSAMVSHATGNATASIIDRWSLVVTAWLVAGFAIDEYTQALAAAYFRDRSQGLRSRPRLLVRGIGWALTVSLSWFFLALDAQQHDQGLITLAFALPLLASLVLALCIMGSSATAHSAAVVGPAAAAQWVWARRRLGAGLLAAAVGIATNFVTEEYCDSSTGLFAIVPGHAIWHVCMSWGLFNMLIYAALLRLDDSVYPLLRLLPSPVPSSALRNEHAFSDCCRCLQRAYFTVLPGFEFVAELGSGVHATTATSPCSEKLIQLHSMDALETPPDQLACALAWLEGAPASGLAEGAQLSAVIRKKLACAEARLAFGLPRAPASESCSVIVSSTPGTSTASEREQWARGARQPHTPTATREGTLSQSV